MNDEAGFLKTVLDYGWGVILALLGLVWKSNNEKIDAIHERIREVKSDSDAEQTIQRGHIAKIFDKLEEHGRRSEDRHRELLNALHAGLAQKADK